MDRTTFPGISVEAFLAEGDRKALKALKKIPLFPKLIRKFNEIGVDRWIYCWNMATSVRCGPNQYPTLHKILVDCCEILDMPEPELYITNNPFTNAYAGGIERPYITLRSSIVDAMSNEQLYHLMGHELGHIKAGHVLYKTMAHMLLPLLDALGRRTLGLGDAFTMALLLSFYEWSRQAEFTCDRAGLLCAQDFQLSASANLCLTAGPNRLSDEQSVDGFLDQCRAYQDITGLDAIGKLIVLYGSGMATHPLPVFRTQGLEEWHESGAYDRIMSGHYVREGEKAA